MMHVLSFWYQVIIASESLLSEGAFLLKDDGWEGELKRFYLDHLEEERHHAKWLLEDMKGDPGALHYGAAQLAGMAYYLIRHVHPVALLGYMQALEGHGIDPAFVAELEAMHGPSAARTVRIHAENDPEHIKALEAFEIPPEWRPLVENTRAQTLSLVRSM